jgi:signal transduction histidine kinase
MQQEYIALLVDELYTLTRLSSFRSSDQLVGTFGFVFHDFGDSFKKHVPSWINLDETILADLKAGTTDALLDLEIISQLSHLLLDEFGPTLTPEDFDHAQRLRDVCEQLRALLNTAMQRPPDQRLPSSLDQPAVRRQLMFEFDRVLFGPAREMIEITEHLLVNTCLNDEQRKDLEAALHNSRNLHRILLTARPLIETQNFRAMASLSYSYRSPFCGITGYFELVLKHYNEGLDEGQLNHLHELVLYSRTILHMVNDLRDASKLLSGHYEETRIVEPIVQPHTVTQALAFHAPPHLDVQIQISDTLPSVRMGDSYFLLCLLNLLNNAIKYTREGCISVTATQEDECVVFQVKDTGIGIPQDQQQAIFEPFVQVGEQTKGLGLGLYLARQFVQRAGGTLTVESEEGIGSVFRLSVPIAHEAAL